MKEQRHSVDPTLPLFLARQASIAQDNMLCARYQVSRNDLLDERLHRVLLYAHANGTDPIGIWKHFQAWQLAAQKNLLQPPSVIFVSLPSLQQDPLVAAALRVFLKRADQHQLLAYTPKTYSQYRMYGDSTITSTSTLSANATKSGSGGGYTRTYEPRPGSGGAGGAREQIVHGSAVLQTLSRSIETFIASQRHAGS
jgi:hypothetical protein